ncbi:YtxH domain-containing protein [Clostridium botulinum]|uniref:YtxH domain-containing protein n=1 Tax=Clostridium botulinum TaxID=1491 RepID=A0A9Q1UZN1_CLOBO|nr:YtxH domain-containing protein [Clostridium botulinum]AEB75429.1 hypothetical protein CbC4_0749 [Clostridium botulinum BKT015925]KLU76391.1 hypothetical protein CBC3_04090 [Clostridium botulinum V891]KOA73178.1 hypothetical protein ADU78_13160 [Clostridium botulinum]KOA79694.1 hypothetical protein ADU77_03690 [Clostridium botulinum]KOA85980.1 hypothetical protein ADU80_06060 [Clostridium botulinum]
MHRFLRGLTTGAIIGATAGIMMSPQMDKRTRKKLMRSKRHMIHKAENMVENLTDWLS